jgi:phosphoglycerol transferase MdoB-like AlkP superfamily enzyme
LQVEKLKPGTRSILAGFALLILVYSWIDRPTLSDARHMVDSVSAEVVDNFRASLVSQQAVEAFDIASPFRVYDYAQYTLREKPDVYLIFMESYGSVLYTKEHFQDLYLEFLDDFEERIEAAGWSATSIFSKAPTWGGGTWISYTSAMYGLSIQEQSQYKALHESYQQIPYPNMGRYLQTQGYEHVWIAPIERRISPERETADDNFFGVDHWITLETMNYQGPLFGWGPSPPDQYTFGYIGDFIHAQQQPTFLVFLTQNSHYPWKPMPPEVRDWRTFSEMDPDDDLLKGNSETKIVFRESRQNYIKAMAYTFKALGEFITNLDNPEAVIILMGDHQPPAVSYKGDGYKTMVHIISQDDVFLSAFDNYGFTDGLILNDLEVNMMHEGFYSLFVRNLVARYGEKPQTLPPYLPNGLLFTQP